jgi:hypothetical protein
VAHVEDPSVGTVPSDEAILDQIEAPGPTLLSASGNRRNTCILEQGMVFPECTDPRLSHVRHCLSRIQHTGVETLVLKGVIMGTDFEWVRTTLGLFPSLKMLEAALVIAGDSPRAISRRVLEIGLLSENKDWIAIETVSQGVKPFRELREALDDSWEFNVVADWPGKVREDSFQIILEKQQ